MKRLRSFLLALLLLLLGRAARAQVGVGTATPDASAAPDISSSARGLLLPRLTTAQRTAIARPALGLLVFQTDGAQPGFWYNVGPPPRPGRSSAPPPPVTTWATTSPPRP